MRVYLVRHAEAEQGSPDELRQLTKRGIEDAVLLGKKLSTHQLKINSIVHSGLSRAKQTAELIAQQLEVTNIKEESDLKPNASTNKWSSRLEKVQSDMMIVGHMPYMSLLVENLTCHQDTVIFHSPQVVCLEKQREGTWRVLWKEGV